MKMIRKMVIAAVMAAMMSSAAFAAGIGENKALSIALKNAGLGKTEVYGVETDYDDGNIEVEFVRKSNKAEYGYEISAGSGKVIKKSVDYRYRHQRSNKKIGKKAAIKKVAKFSGIKYSVIKKGSCRYDIDDGEGRYEIKFRKGNYRYEFDVLARNGKIVEYEQKLIRR